MPTIGQRNSPSLQQQLSGRDHHIKKKSPYESISANKQILLNNNSEASLQVEIDNKTTSAHDNYY